MKLIYFYYFLFKTYLHSSCSFSCIAVSAYRTDYVRYYHIINCSSKKGLRYLLKSKGLRYLLKSLSKVVQTGHSSSSWASSSIFPRVMSWRILYLSICRITSLKYTVSWLTLTHTLLFCKRRTEKTCHLRIFNLSWMLRLWPYSTFFSFINVALPFLKQNLHFTVLELIRILTVQPDASLLILSELFKKK